MTDAAEIHRLRFGVEFHFRGLCDSSALVVASKGAALDASVVRDCIVLKAASKGLREHKQAITPPDNVVKDQSPSAEQAFARWALDACRVQDRSAGPVMVVDCTATDAITPALVHAISAGPHVRVATTPNVLLMVHHSFILRFKPLW